jgi:hypothetical protein
MRGVAVGARWNELADKAEARIGDHLSVWTLPHWMLALTAAGRDSAARSMLSSMNEDPSAAVREVALPVCLAVLAHRRGQHERAVELMVPVMGRLRELGGSHAQRDVLAQLFADSIRRSQRAVA